MNENKMDNKPGRNLLSLAAALALLGTAGGVGAAPAPDRSGKEVVEAVCAGCHAAGKDGAPKIGDQADWSKRASQGLGSMTKNAITGVRKMPAHGGQSSLTDLEISRAVAYMVSDGTAPEPNKPYASPKQKGGEQLVRERCQDCHAAGKDGAPRIGDMEAWKPRLQAGVDPLVKSAIRGHKAMPARGGMASLSDADMKAAVVFMVNQGAAGGAK
jgi:cytochrome c5